MLDEEIWKDIKGYEGKYQISNTGQVKSLSYHGTGQERTLKNVLDSKGYYRISLSKDGIIKQLQIHRIVAEAFISNPENKPQINHKDSVRTNNHVNNLEWSTSAENIQHGYDKGFITAKGEDNGQAKLDAQKVARIRELYATGRYTQEALGNHFGVGSRAISLIIRNKRWKYASAYPNNKCP